MSPGAFLRDGFQGWLFIFWKHTRQSSIPQQVRGGHLDFDTADVDVMLLRCILAPLSTVVDSLLLLGRRQGLPSIFNNTTSALVTSIAEILNICQVYSTHCIQNKPT